MKEDEMGPGGDAPTVVTERIQWTQAELVAEAAARFGEDPKRWAFQCPNCGDIACAQDFLDAGVPAERIAIGQECIGRATGALAKPEPTNTRGCNWCAYGLFRGPWLVTMSSGKEVASFRLAPAPPDHTRRGRMLRITDDRHSDTRHFARLFSYDHIPNGQLRTVSRYCSELAQLMVNELPDGPELTAGLRKLLESKDCFVRAALEP